MLNSEWGNHNVIFSGNELRHEEGEGYQDMSHSSTPSTFAENFPNISQAPMGSWFNHFSGQNSGNGATGNSNSSNGLARISNSSVRFNQLGCEIVDKALFFEEEIRGEPEACFTRDRFGLNLGGRIYFPEIENEEFQRSYQVSCGARCQIDGCGVDLSTAKNYHRRHKVCEFHSKASSVVAGGHKKRFCQQCSRFHELSEFDHGKRSCRKRLEDHNRRRRKPQTQQRKNPSHIVSSKCSSEWGGMVEDTDAVSVCFEGNEMTTLHSMPCCSSLPKHAAD
ncbi:hypothetical protein AMTRI_Chr13g116400 [Amborella trichopoda]|uniref:SBP-type domain-containing protein n=1 Tax=Amborella trichopoda TaxID=13333 RepID=W1NYQ0_AMBTC|nr:protein LIGULELESS 1 [Amborella trichopoda]ERN00768.1 hypothetical protein AMTR_s00106p00144050 [Amborella trichopoda]|eukprot:XP_006838199.1 protein LIGULELESS 1 [Amborella trichopoda]